MADRAKNVSFWALTVPMETDREGEEPHFLVKISVTESPGAVRVVLTGDDNTAQNVEDLRAKLDAAFASTEKVVVTLDVTELYYLGSEGVGVIAAAHRVAKEKGHELVIVNPSRQVSRVFMVTRIESFLNIKRDQ